ncbi:MAG: thiol:disulfide interchange protein DsbD [Gammaproteobacteria bacterium]|nr:MAG: thiol:disulfide interchange protein DsbD [Gammaproteobacteria bacterium]TND05829.1 MAG: thiol:disulfide interchange protein DsbD [Gammaproteobacteria bacterium]
MSMRNAARRVSAAIHLFCPARQVALLLAIAACWFAGVAVATESGNAFTPVERSGGSLLERLSSFGEKLGLVDTSRDFLDPDKAFVLSADVIDAHTIAARWQIADGYYMYRDKFAFKLANPGDAQIGAIQTSAGKPKADETFGTTEVYYHDTTVIVPLKRINQSPVDVVLEARYQGCADAGFCYPPITKTMQLSLPAVTASAGTAPAASDFVSEQDRFARTLAGGNTLRTITIFFGVGLLLAFTPCVFPMVPILSGIIVGQGHGLTTRHAFLLSAAYVLPMALTYTVAGVLAGLFGANLQAVFQNPWIIGSFVAIFVLLALSMFGFYELQIPASIQSRLAALSNRQKGGTFIGVAIMGFLSALIVGPCVAAPLAGALIYIGNTGDAPLGGMALFALSMGMGAPLLALGTSAGKLLPRAGPWMQPIKAVFGVMLLAVAIWMLDRIVPPAVTLVLTALLLIICAVFVGALDRLDGNTGGWKRLWKGSGLVMLVYGVVLLVGAASGGNDILHPLRGTSLVAGGGNSAVSHLTFKPVKGLDGLNRELQLAAAAGKPVMLDFYADWCVSCKEMERYTFSDQRVRGLLTDVVLLQTDVTANDAEDQALLKHFGLFGPPSILFFNRQGIEQQRYRLVGFLNADDFHDHLGRVLSL